MICNKAYHAHPTMAILFLNHWDVFLVCVWLCPLFLDTYFVYDWLIHLPSSLHDNSIVFSSEVQFGDGHLLQRIYKITIIIQIADFLIRAISYFICTHFAFTKIDNNLEIFVDNSK